MTPIQQRCVDFGRRLLATADLDPLYTMIHTARMDRTEHTRFLLAYGMYYHAGTAATIAEARDFWKAAWEAIPNAPRGTERRHFRGDLAVSSVASMRAFGTPERVMGEMFPEGIVGFPLLSFQEVFDAVQKFRGFGPWIAFKMADIAERTRYAMVDFTGCELSIYRDPVKGAALWRYNDPEAPIQKQEVGEVVEEIRLAVGADLLAPPLYDRPINVQEVETILCKFKSHYNGHYPYGKDTHEILHGLEGVPGDLAARLRACPLL